MKFIPSNTPLRVAVVVPKSVAKKATARNTLRRAVYQALQNSIGGTGAAVFFVLRAPKNADAQAFCTEVAQLVTS